MFDAALPFWADQGVDRLYGGFVELFDARGVASAPYKRTRVAARQVYVFSHASLLGWSRGAELAEHGYRFLVERCRLSDGGWARLLSATGEVSDPTPDLYDVAFVLFALAWYARVSGETEPVRLAHETLDDLEARFRQPTGGFAHALPMAGWRLQNPHMHLLEASLAWMQTAPSNERFRRLADELVTLFSTRLYDPQSQTLGEHFTDDWVRAPGEPGRIVEPGHQFEWAWILASHQRLAGRDNGELVSGLIAFAERHGVDPATQVTFNAVCDDGSVLNRGSRSWPNTERIKAAVAGFERHGINPRPVLAGSAELLLDRYLDDRGTWIDQFDGEGERVGDTVPASTLYHVFLAFTELLRVWPVAQARFPPS